MMNRAKPIGARSVAELIGVFIVLPIAFGGLILIGVIRNALVHAADFTVADWLLQVALAALLAVCLAACLPAVALQELARRRRLRASNNPANARADPPR